MYVVVLPSEWLGRAENPHFGQVAFCIMFSPFPLLQVFSILTKKTIALPFFRHTPGKVFLTPARG